MLVECQRCGAPVSGNNSNEAQCPNCGLRLQQEPLRPLAIIADYFNELRRVIFSPTAYFRKMPGGLRGGRVSRALGFALATHWLGAVMAYFWRALGSGVVDSYVQRFSVWFANDHSVQQLGGDALRQSEMREQLLNWFFGMGSVIADPFLTLVTIFVTATFVYIGARILVPSNRTAVTDITFESAVKIVAYGMSAWILAAIPFVGRFIAPIAAAIVTIIGAREVYQIGTGRAVIVGLFPKLLFVGIILLGVLVVTASLLSFLLSFL